jgi:hypothetical protein
MRAIKIAAALALFLSGCADAINREPSFTETYDRPYDQLAECTYVKLEAVNSGITNKLTDLRSMNEMRLSGDLHSFNTVGLWYIRFIKAGNDRATVEVRAFTSGHALAVREALAACTAS